ncbi:MAG: repeat-containing protein, partial [Bryobacterales bacterium]|nr:repeat-containing protein [Bryobacterales bacterium]
DGTFQAAIGAGTVTDLTVMVVGDFNNDGQADLAIAGDTVNIVLGNGDGTFQPPVSYTAGARSILGLAQGDFNGDGKIDLATANFAFFGSAPSQNAVNVLLGNGDGTFQAPHTWNAGGNPSSVVVGDFDGDGSADIAVGDVNDASVNVLGGKGDGTFRALVAYTADTTFGVRAAAVLDFNGDGVADIVVMGNNTGNLNLVAGSPAVTISFGPLSDQAFGAGPIALHATASSGLPVSFTSNPPAVCTVSGASLSIAGVGTCVVTASQPGDSTHAKALSVTRSFTISPPASQTITFGAVGGQTFGVAPFTVGATASSGLPVSFTSSTPGVCTVSGSTVTILAAGTCSLTASQPGNANYPAAPAVNQMFMVVQAAQTIAFGPSGGQTFGVAPSTIGATASSGLPVNFTSNTMGVCTVSGSTATVLTAGTCSITASQPGNTNYFAAPVVTRTFAVAQAAQTITFGPLSNQPAGAGPFTIGATASSSLPVNFASNTSGVCTVSGFTVTILGSGQCSITASQPGNANYLAAVSITRTFGVSQVTQTIAFGALPNRLYTAAPFTIAATASSGLPVSFTAGPLSVCSAFANSVTILGAGVCTIQATQSGNSSLAAAMPVIRAFTVTGNPSGTLAAASPIGAGVFPSSAAAADFNGDGKPDLAIPNASDGTVTLLLGNGSGGFAPAAGSPFKVGNNPTSIAAADFNGDGKPDLVIANANDNTVTVLIGDGTGLFAPASGSPFAAGNFPVSVAAGDLNGDGNLDLAIANLNSSRVTVLLGNGAGGFSAAPGSPFAAGAQPIFLVVADFNGDGFNDIALADFGAKQVTLLLGNGAAGFSPAPKSPISVGTNPSSLAVGDFNKDGQPDLVVTNSSDNTATMLLGDGAGGFTPSAQSPLATGKFPSFVTAGDLDGDGNPDVAIVNQNDNSITVLLGNGSGGFSPARGGAFAVGSLPGLAVAADFNLDGKLDLAVPNGGDNNVTVLLGKTAPVTAVLSTTSAATILPGAAVPLTLAVGFTAPAFDAPAGTVTFYDGAAVLGATTQAPYAFTASNLNAGSHSFAAKYNGDARTQSLTSNSLAILAQAATIINVASTTANGTYGAGSAIAITVTFNRPVTVTGTPQLSLNSGGTAAYSSGSGTATLTFGYVVAAGESSAHLDAPAANSLVLNGGTIVDAGSAAASLTLPAPGAPGSLGANANIVVATSQPATDVSSQVKVTGTGLVFSRVSNAFSGTVTIANNRLTPIAAPIQLVFTNLIKGATLTTQTGTVPAGTYAGAPYMTVSGNSPLAPGSSVTVVVKFTYTGTAPIAYIAKTLSGKF